MRSRRFLVTALLALPLLAAPSATRSAHADEVRAPAVGLAPLLGRLADHAERFEQMKKRGSFTLSGKIEELDGKGHVDATKEMVLRSTATPSERVTEILKYLEDGADKTAEAKKKADASRAERKKKAEKPKDMHLPFLASEQPRYTFSLVERDPADPHRVKVGFVPLVPAENAFKGSAWVDETSGEVLTLGLSPTKNPTFVDHVDVTMRFDHLTPLGRAPSNLTFELRGGFLVVKKHVRGSAAITDPRLGF